MALELNLTLNTNDGDPYGMAQIMSGSNTYTLPARTRTGYVFLGWATSADAPINNLDAGLRAGCEITPTANLTLYGAWLPSPVQMADDADNSDVIAALNGLDNVNVKLQGRTLYKDGKWNTICLPFFVTIVGSVLDGAVVRSLTSASITDNETAGQTLHLTFSDAVTELQAGVPYIIKWDEGDDITNPEFTNVTVVSDAPQSQSFTNNGTKVSFVGTYSPKELTANTTANLYLGSNNKLLYPTQEGFKVNAFRAYFEIETTDAEAKQFSNIVLDFGEEEATGKELRGGGRNDGERGG